MRGEGGEMGDGILRLGGCGVRRGRGGAPSRGPEPGGEEVRRDATGREPPGAPGLGEAPVRVDRAVVVAADDAQGREARTHERDGGDVRGELRERERERVRDALSPLRRREGRGDHAPRRRPEPRERQVGERGEDGHRRSPDGGRDPAPTQQVGDVARVPRVIHGGRRWDDDGPRRPRVSARAEGEAGRSRSVRAEFKLGSQTQRSRF